jgi:putative membrane protein insertion efficiency factor
VFLVVIINLYQKYISANHGILRYSKPICPFEPSCSEYTKQAVLDHGSIKGLYIGLCRVLKCHPFSSSYKQAVKDRIGE